MVRLKHSWVWLISDTEIILVWIRFDDFDVHCNAYPTHLINTRKCL